MKARLDPYQASPDVMQAMIQLEERVRSAGLEPSLIQLVKTRASQLNGCAFCLHMHTQHARAAGESEERLYLVSAWRESPLFTPRERAALAWTEALTLLAQSGAPDRDYNELCEHFSESDRVKLSMLIVAINGWNRIAVGFRLVHPTAPNRAAS
jgi:AhpD family alkylhydroperoxidase